MAGYWPSSFFCVVSVHKHAKKNQCPAIVTEQAWSKKDLLYGIKDQKMVFGLEIPKSRAGKIAPSCPLTELVIYIVNRITVLE